MGYMFLLNWVDDGCGVMFAPLLGRKFSCHLYDVDIEYIKYIFFVFDDVS